MGWLLKTGGVVAVLAVVLVIKPEIVLHLPNGFIPYAILGHPPVAYFTFEGYQNGNFDTWAKDGDVVIAAGAKCGTNWLLYMSHLIRTKGNTKDFPFKDVTYSTPWMGLRHFPGQEWPQIKEGYETAILKDGSKLKDQWDHPKFPFRVFKSHESPDDDVNGGPTAVLPVRRRRGVKFVAAVRNTYDQLRSMYPFFSSHSAQFRRMWGDFPPLYSSKAAMMDDFIGGPLDNLVWGYPNTWWKYRDDSNVLLISYDQMLADPKGHAEKLAKFMDVSLTPTEIDNIVKLTSFAEMKKKDSAFNYQLWGHPDYKTQDGGYPVMNNGELLRAGKKGEGKEFFSAEELARIKSAIDKEFTNKELRKFIGV